MRTGKVMTAEKGKMSRDGHQGRLSLLSKLPRVLRVAGWNALVLAAGLTLIGSASEAWLRLTVPFMENLIPWQFTPRVGYLMKPNAEVRYTNKLDFWTISHTNSLGFLDREILSLDRAQASCHVAVIGGSLVEAREVSIADKLPVRLENLAAQELPELDVTSSAFGIGGAGSVHQLGFYDEYVRHLHPKLLVLVFTPTDFIRNSPILHSLTTGNDLEWRGWVTAKRGIRGKIRLYLPDPDTRRERIPGSPDSNLKNTAKKSYFLRWVHAKLVLLFRRGDSESIAARYERLRRRLGCKGLLGEWQPTGAGLGGEFVKKNLPPVFEDALEFTAFALDQFKERTDRDAVSLVILASHRMKVLGKRLFDRLHALAEARGIPVIDQYDHILGRGAEPREAEWPHDQHWNATGHRWAAEAVLDYLGRNPAICRLGDGSSSTSRTVQKSAS